MYYGLDSAVEAVLADLICGADAVSPSYTRTLNEVTPSIGIATPGTAAAPASTQQYSDPALRNPQLLRVPSGSSYLVHILHMRQSPLEVNWAFDVPATTKAAPLGTFRVKMLGGAARLPSGGGALAVTSETASSVGTFSLITGFVAIIQPGTYSIAFCVVTLSKEAMTTRPFKPAGAATDTWVYDVAYKDYQATVSAGGPR